MLMQEELNQMVQLETEKLGVGSKAFIQRHNDLMEQIEQLLEENRQRRAARQMLGAKDVMELLGVSELKAYGYIRQMNIELEKKGYITVRGKVPVAYFRERNACVSYKFRIVFMVQFDKDSHNPSAL